MSKKIAIVFPGQGSQYAGMGLTLIDAGAHCKEVMAEATGILGYDVAEKLRKATEEELQDTLLTQPMIYVLNHLSFRCLMESGVTAHFVGGHSLGELSALTAAGMISFQDGLRLVKRRAELMSQAAAKYPGKMLAVIGLSDEAVSGVMSLMKPTGVLNVANYNCPGQVILSGSNDAVELAEIVFKEKGARRLIPLAVSGAFHSPLMKDAQKAFNEEIDALNWKEPVIPVVSNSTGEVSHEKNVILAALKKQIAGSVLWTNCIAKLIELGVDIFVEAGPSKVLCGLIKKIHREIEVYSAEDVSTLEHTVKALKAEGLIRTS